MLFLIVLQVLVSFDRSKASCMQALECGGVVRDSISEAGKKNEWDGVQCVSVRSQECNLNYLPCM